MKQVVFKGGIENIAGRDKKEGKGMKININLMTFNQPKAMLVINTQRFQRPGEDHGSSKTSKVNLRQAKT